MSDDARHTPFGERLTSRGEVIITPLQRDLLQTLLDAPGHAFPTMKAWAAAANPGGRNPGSMLRAVRRVPEVWASKRRYGGGKLCQLQARGRSVIEGRVPVHVLGDGPLKPLPDAGGELSYHLRRIGSTEEGMSLGQLVDSLAHARRVLARSRDPRVVERYRDHVERTERLLENLRTGLLEGPGVPIHDRRWLSELATARRRGDLQRFMRFTRAVDRWALPEAAELALGFNRPWDRLQAMEELVFVGEARALGLEPADERRQQWREESRVALTRRLLDVVPRR